MRSRAELSEADSHGIIFIYLLNTTFIDKPTTNKFASNCVMLFVCQANPKQIAITL